MFICEEPENILWVHYDLESFRYSCVKHGGQDRRAISQVPHLAYAEPFLFYANVISVGRDENVAMQGNYRGTPGTGGAITGVIEHFEFLFLPGYKLFLSREVNFCDAGCSETVSEAVQGQLAGYQWF